MNVGTNGIVVDPHGNVLLIKRNDTRTFAPPGGALDAGELPTDSVAREVQEETGLIVLPVRLVALTYLPLTPHGFLGFTFRCLLRGGDITPSEESPTVGYFKTDPLPHRMSSFHRERVEKGVNHAGERPLFFQHRLSTLTKATRFVLRHVVYRWLDLKRKLKKQPLFQPPRIWEVHTYLLCPNENGEFLWHRPTENAEWQLPGGLATGLEAPWETAVKLAYQQTGQQIRPQHLTAVYTGPKPTVLTLVFLSQTNLWQTSSTNMPTSVPNQSTKNLGWFAPGTEPANTHPQQCQIAVAKTNNPLTQFHKL